MGYSAMFREKMVQKMTGPGSMTANALSLTLRLRRFEHLHGCVIGHVARRAALILDAD